MGTNSAGSARRRRLWIAVALVYGAARVALAGAFLARYGLNVWVFGVVEMSSSFLLGLASGRLVESILRAERGRRLLLISGSLVGYATPDIYVLVFAGQFPATTLAVVVGVIVATTVASMVSFVAQLRNTRSASAATR